MSSDEIETHQPAPQPPPTLPCEIALAYSDRVSFAMQQNGVPWVDSVALTLKHTTPIEDITIRLSLDNDEAEPWVGRLARLDPETQIALTPDTFVLSAKTLAMRTEAERTAIVCEVTSAEGAMKKIFPIDLLAFDQWPGVGYFPELTAAFVTPNHPKVAELLHIARGVLSEQNDSDALDGYQSKSRQRASLIAEACFNAVAAQNIGYINPPASFELTGQRVRLIDQVIRENFGTCLDLSLTLMSMWEQCGLHPLVLLPEGHAMPAVWTHDAHLAEAVIDEPARIRNLIELGEIIPVEATHLTQRGAMFAGAIDAAKEKIQSPGNAFHAVDIRSARKRGVRPLPLRDDGQSGVDLDAVKTEVHQTANSTIDRVALADRAEAWEREQDSISDEQVPAAARILRWQKRLLDLSLRNRLLNYKETGRTLPISVPDLPELENKLANGERFKVLPKQDDTQAFLRDELADNHLRANATDAESQKRLLNLYRTAKSSIEETGANVLYLALGLLKWYEHDNADQERFAPLVMLPVTLVRGSASGGGYTYTLQLSEEPLYPNVTLLEKLRVDFGVETDGLDDLPEDENGLDIDLIFRNFRSAIRNMPRWEVLDACSIGLFSFNKFLMWKDLQEKTDRLKENRLVEHLVELPDADFDVRPFPDSAKLDDELRPDDLLCTRDADSSQLAAICAAAEERTFVLEGPPGTGKSQTIANVIADALARGRRVLFVAEKMAALSVVRKRLEEDGLGPFCLELHSAKASKKQVLAQIEESLHAPRGSEPANWKAMCQELGTTRDTLNDYIRAMHEPRAIGESLYRMLGRLNLIGDGQTVTPPTETPAQTTADELDAWLHAIAQLRERARPIDPVHEFSLRGIGTCEWSFALPQQAQDTLSTGQRSADALKVSLAAFLRETGADRSPDAPGRAAVMALSDAAQQLLTCPTPSRDLLAGPHAAALRQRANEASALGRDRDTKHQELYKTYREEFIDLDPLVHIDAIQRHLKRPGILRLFTARGVKKPLRVYAKNNLPALSQVAQHLELLREIKQLNKQLDDYTDLAQAFGPSWNGGTADWDQVDAVTHWCEAFTGTLNTFDADDALPGLSEAFINIAATPGQADNLKPVAEQLITSWDAWTRDWQAIEQALATDSDMAFGQASPGWLAEVSSTLTRWQSNLSELNTWCSWRESRDAAISIGLTDLVECYEHGDCPIDDIETIFWRSFGNAWFAAVADNTEPVRRFNADAHMSTAERFRLLDKQAIYLTRHLIAARLDAERPRPSNSVSSQSEMGILRREIEKKRRHLPTRRLIESIPTLLPKLKPCFLMSPLSVAQFLAAELPPFDLVVFDEASQIPVWDAIGAIARGKEVIVVGDSKQLPPTTFFSTLDDGEDDFDENDHAVDDMESILKECNASGIPGMRLRWHYRSRHESLITFSNHHYYQNELHTFPSPVERSRDLGVTFRHVEDGVYDRGGTRTNRVEAQQVVDQVVEMLLDPAASKSIGVVTFSQAQQNLVEDLLDKRRRETPEIEVYLGSAAPEPVFIKNLENVQGDERDTIIFSVGYGPDQNGKQSMNFGPLNKDGGERRLNVAVTRARRRLIVFASMTSDNIDLNRTRATGVRHFKTFLDYAKRGPLAIPDAEALTDDLDFESGFEAVVCNALTERGWAIDTRVGCAGYRIDLAVKHPDKPDSYVVGIECDGRSYHSAKTARDRDRIREAVLEGLGWQIERVWSTQWQVNPQGCIEQLHRTIEEAIARADEGEQAQHTPQVQSLPSEDEEPEATDWLSTAVSTPKPQDETPGLPVYQPARLTKRETAIKDIYADSASSRLVKALSRIVELESPVTQDLAMQRFADAFEITRSTQRFRDRFEEIRDAAISQGTIQTLADDLWRVDHGPSSFEAIRIADENEVSQRDIDDIPLIELTNACAYVLAHQFGLPREDLIREAAKLFGISRATARVTEQVGQAIDQLIEQGKAHDNAGRITPSN